MVREHTKKTPTLIRQHFPKTTDFREITERRSGGWPTASTIGLGFRTPHQAFFEETNRASTG
jgi:IS30 family transposase